MPLSAQDIKRLEKAGYDKKQFAYLARQGYVQLRNYHNYCIFYDLEKHRCKTYKHRPEGCRIYPVINCEEEGAIVDDLCPMKNTVSKKELKRKAKELTTLLQRIDRQARKRTDLRKTRAQ